MPSQIIAHDVTIEELTRYQHVDNFMAMLDWSSKVELKANIDLLKAYSENPSTGSNNRRIAKNVLTVMRKEMKQFA